MKKIFPFIVVILFIGMCILLVKINKRQLTPEVQSGISKQETNITSDNIITNVNNNDRFEYCIAHGGKDTTPNYNGLKDCVLDNQDYQSSCVNNNNYFIVSKDAADYAGSDILVKYKTSPNQKMDCKYSSESSDFEILNNEQAQYILALEGNYLILDSGTGPDYRGLMIYDLIKRKMILTDTYFDPFDIKINSITYWTETSQKVTKNNCPILSSVDPSSNTGLSSNGLPLIIEKHITLDLNTLIKKDLGEQRCSETQ